MREQTGAAKLQKSFSPGLEVITLKRRSYEEYFITSVPDGSESVESLFQRTARAVRERNAQVVSQEVFEIEDKDGAGMQSLKDAFGETKGPVIWLFNKHCTNLCGTHLWAVSGTEVKPVEADGKIVGSTFEDNNVQYYRLNGLLPEDATKSRDEQAWEIFEQMDSLLQANGMEFNHVLRTWFYNDNILKWYSNFNKVRDSFFEKKRIYEGLVPASTGVGGRNTAGAALTGGLLAIKAKGNGMRAFAVPSPLQLSAIEYGSSFSRAVELDVADHRRLYVSGTASIDQYGKTSHIDDPDAQVKLAMKVVHAILESRNMDWSDVTRAFGYFKHSEDVPVLEKYLLKNNLPQFPVVVVENDICREDLLFEIEVDAIVTE